MAIRLRPTINCIFSGRMPKIVAVLFLLVACAVPAYAQMPSVPLVLRDHQFVPAEVPVPAGAKVELLVRNEQAMPAEFESSSLHREKIVTPGASISVYVGPLDPGRYEFFDDFHPSTRGFLVVK
jgi:plastocyanin